MAVYISYNECSLPYLAHTYYNTPHYYHTVLLDHRSKLRGKPVNKMYIKKIPIMMS